VLIKKTGGLCIAQTACAREKKIKEKNTKTLGAVKILRAYVRDTKQRDAVLGKEKDGRT